MFKKRRIGKPQVVDGKNASFIYIKKQIKQNKKAKAIQIQRRANARSYSHTDSERYYRLLRDIQYSRHIQNKHTTKYRFGSLKCTRHRDVGEQPTLAHFNCVYSISKYDARGSTGGRAEHNRTTPGRCALVLLLFGGEEEFLAQHRQRVCVEKKG